jgi:hypothetical protein
MLVSLILIPVIYHLMHWRERPAQKAASADVSTPNN